MTNINISQGALIVQTTDEDMWPQNPQSLLVNGQTLSLQTLIEGFQFAGDEKSPGLNFPLLNPDDTLRHEAVHKIIGPQNRENFANIYGLFQILFDGHGRMPPHRIHADLPWHFERDPLPKGNVLYFYHRPFGPRLTLSPWEEDKLQVTVERVTPFASVKTWVGYDPSGQGPISYRHAFFVQLNSERLKAGSSFPLFAETVEAFEQDNFKGHPITQLNSPGLPEKRQVSDSFAALSLNVLPAQSETQLLRGAFFYTPGQQQEGLDFLIRQLWNDAYLATQLPKPIPPFTYGNPRRLLGELTGIVDSTNDLDEKFGDILANPDSVMLETWADTPKRLNLADVENPALFSAREHLLGSQLLSSTGRRSVVYVPNRSSHIGRIMRLRG